MRPHLALAEMRDVLAVEPDRAFGRLEQAQQHLADGRLAAAGLADQAQRLARIDREADAVDRLDQRDRAREQAALQREMLLQVRRLRRPGSCGGPVGASTRSASWQATTWPVADRRATPAPRRGSARPHRRSAARTRSLRSARAATARCRESRRGGACGSSRAGAGSRPSGRACRDAPGGRTARWSRLPRSCGPHTSRSRGGRSRPRCRDCA